MRVMELAFRKAGILPSFFLRPAVVERARKEMHTDLKLRRLAEVKTLIIARVPVERFEKGDVELAVRELGARRTRKGQLLLPSMPGWKQAGIRNHS